ncbi:MAG: hypothetical protein IJO76_05070 [Clostridia bacterium]|nr:hypothetical protein [Clostridia bacterium]
MTKTKSTKRALLMSALSLLLCVSMLVGSTFAWFTDSVSSGSNIIKSGKLEIALLDADGVSLEGEMIEWVAKDGRAQDEILWEPGCTYNSEDVYVKNIGNLNLKFKILVNGIEGDAKLLEVIDFAAIAKNQTVSFEHPLGMATTTMDLDLLNGTTYDSGISFGGQSSTLTIDEYILKPGEQMGPIVLSGHMDEMAGNEYQDLTVKGISISVVATQAIGEEDSFDGTYDAQAVYPGLSSGTLEPGQAAIEIPVTDGTDAKVGTATIPAEALAPGKTSSDAQILPSGYVGNFTVATGMTAKAYEITVSNLKENNDVPVKVLVYIGKGLDPTTVKMYHYDEEIPCTYSPYDGYVTFASAQFSPFTLVYDADSEYVAPDALPDDLPKATVVDSDEYENVDLPWGKYGSWSPTEGLDSQLEAAYTFSCTETLEEAEANPYANWECDFYVKLDRDLEANQIFLGGNYGSFGWVGFHNGDLTLEANTEIPLLGSVAGAWSYVDVVQNVGNFICGVGDVDDALTGATFTVMLRLTNPEDATEFYNVATITHTF